VDARPDLVDTSLFVDRSFHRLDGCRNGRFRRGARLDRLDHGRVRHWSVRQLLELSCLSAVDPDGYVARCPGALRFCRYRRLARRARLFLLYGFLAYRIAVLVPKHRRVSCRSEALLDLARAGSPLAGPVDQSLGCARRICRRTRGPLPHQTAQSAADETSPSVGIDEEHIHIGLGCGGGLQSHLDVQGDV